MSGTLLRLNNHCCERYPRESHKHWIQRAAPQSGRRSFEGAGRRPRQVRYACPHSVHDAFDLRNRFNGASWALVHTAVANFDRSARDQVSESLSAADTCCRTRSCGPPGGFAEAASARGGGASLLGRAASAQFGAAVRSEITYRRRKSLRNRRGLFCYSPSPSSSPVPLIRRKPFPPKAPEHRVAAMPKGRFQSGQPERDCAEPQSPKGGYA